MQSSTLHPTFADILNVWVSAKLCQNCEAKAATETVTDPRFPDKPAFRMCAECAAADHAEFVRLGYYPEAS